MSRRKKICTQILDHNCKGLVWRQIKNTLQHKEFIIKKSKTGGSSRSITHDNMVLFRRQGRLHSFSADCFNVHVSKGNKSEIDEDDCKKIKKAMEELDLGHC